MVAVPLLLLLLLESLLCLFLMLEQNDFKLKSNDLKLIILELRFIDFLVFGCDANDAPAAADAAGGVCIGCEPIISVATFIIGLWAATVSIASAVLQIKSKRRLLLFNLAELSMRCLVAVVIESVLISVANGKFNCGRFSGLEETDDVIVLVVVAVV